MLVYLLLNRITGLGYVGQTTQRLLARWNKHKSDAAMGSDSYIHRAIRKYGHENFEVSILAKANNLPELNLLEQLHVKLQNTMHPHGYNLTTGGDRVRQHADSNAKRSAALKGRIFSPEHRARLSKASTGRILDEATRKKISALKTGNKYRLGQSPSPETRKKLSLAKIKSATAKLATNLLQ